MYTEFFELTEPPFSNTPDPRFFFPTPDHEEALASLVYAVKELKGFAVLTGEVGAGKTLVARMMLRRFGTRIAFANIHHAVRSARDLIKAVCAEFELRDDDIGDAQRVRLLHDYLLRQYADNTPVVLVLDEAQNLPFDAFEELRMIGNLEADSAKLLQIIIVGQPELREHFRSPQLRQLRQRVFRRFHLGRLSRDQTEGYIAHRLRVAGAHKQNIFDGDAVDRIHDVSHGLPRLINTACDNAMLSAYGADLRTVDGPFMTSVVEQLMSHDRAHPPGADGPGDASCVACDRDPRDLSTAIRVPRILRTGHGRGDGKDLAAWPTDAPRPDIEDALVRIERLERQARPSDQDIRQAHHLAGALEATLTRTTETIRRAEGATAVLDRRQVAAEKLVQVLKSLHDKTLRAVRTFNDAGARYARLEHNAQRMYHRLVAQAQRTVRLTSIARDAVSRMNKRTAVADPAVEPPAETPTPCRVDRAVAPDDADETVTSRHAAASVQRSVAKPPAGIAYAPTPTGTASAAHFEQLLTQSRESLTDLRALIDATTGLPTSADPRASWTAHALAAANAGVASRRHAAGSADATSAPPRHASAGAETGPAPQACVGGGGDVVPAPGARARPPTCTAGGDATPASAEPGASGLSDAVPDARLVEHVQGLLKLVTTPGPDHQRRDGA
ncbi:MAG: AAA family ATPase [Phycisphaerae bacterium]